MTQAEIMLQPDVQAELIEFIVWAQAVDESFGRDHLDAVLQPTLGRVGGLSSYAVRRTVIQELRWLRDPRSGFERTRGANYRRLYDVLSRRCEKTAP